MGICRPHQPAGAQFIRLRGGARIFSGNMTMADAMTGRAITSIPELAGRKSRLRRRHHNDIRRRKRSRPIGTASGQSEFRGEAVSGHVFCRRLQIRHERHARPRRSTAGRTSRAAPASASTIPGMVNRAAISRRHDRALAGRKPARSFRYVCDGPSIAVGSSMGGWISLLLARELRAARQASQPRRSRADCTRCRFHRSADVAAIPARDQTADRDAGIVAAAVAIFAGALSHHPAIDRGRTQSSVARRADRDRLPGAHPAGREGRGRAVAARGRLVSCIARDDVGADAGQGRRPPAVAARRISSGCWQRSRNSVRPGGRCTAYGSRIPQSSEGKTMR